MAKQQKTTVEVAPSPVSASERDQVEDATAPVNGLVELNQPAEAQVSLVERDQQDDRDALIADLRERLRLAQARAAAPVQMPAGPRALYRVALAGARCKRPTITVEPNERSSEKHKDAPVVTYDGLTLFVESGDVNVQAQAWKRYSATHKLEAGARRNFRVRVDGGPTLDSLEIPASSPYEAEALFKRFNGVISTDRQFTIERIDAQGPSEELASK